MKEIFLTLPPILENPDQKENHTQSSLAAPWPEAHSHHPPKPKMDKNSFYFHHDKFTL
jgi:hypothetical protein